MDIIRLVPRPPLVAFLIGLTGWLATIVYLKRPFHADMSDDGQYLVSARALCDLKGYRLTSRLGDPVATKYPMGLPLITALVMAMLPGAPSPEHDLLAGRIVVVISGLVFAVACRWLFRISEISDWSASLLSLALIWNPLIMKHLATSLLSDLPYAALSTLMILRWTRRLPSESASARQSLIDGLIVGSAWLIRANGFTLAIAALAAALQNRSKWTSVVAVLIGVACLKIPASLYYYSLPGPWETGDYVTEQAAAYQAASHLWSIPMANLERLPGLLASAIFPPMGWTAVVMAFFSRWTVAHWVVCLASFAVLACGIRRSLQRQTWPAAVWIHAFLTLLIYLLWHFRIDHRFLLPLLPLVLALCVTGVDVITNRKAISTLFCAGSLAGSLVVGAGMLWRSLPYDGIMIDFRSDSISRALNTIIHDTPVDSVVFCPIPELVYLNTGRKAAPLKSDALRFSDRPALLDHLQRTMESAGDRPIYLYIDETEGVTRDEIATLCIEGRLRVVPVFETNRFYVWLVQRAREPDR